MAGKKKNPTEPAGAARHPGALRPILLAGGLGLLWFAQTPLGGLPDDAPMWSVAAIIAVRLVADFVGGWVAVSLLRLAAAVVRYLICRTRAAA